MKDERQRTYQVLPHRSHYVVHVTLPTGVYAVRAYYQTKERARLAIKRIFQSLLTDEQIMNDARFFLYSPPAEDKIVWVREHFRVIKVKPCFA